MTGNKTSGKGGKLKDIWKSADTFKNEQFILKLKNELQQKPFGLKPWNLMQRWLHTEQERKTNSINDFANFRKGLLRSPKSRLWTAPKQAIVAFNLNLCSRIKSADCQGSIPLVTIALQFISNNK